MSCCQVLFKILYYKLNNELWKLINIVYAVMSMFLKRTEKILSGHWIDLEMDNFVSVNYQLYLLKFSAVCNECKT